MPSLRLNQFTDDEFYEYNDPRQRDRYAGPRPARKKPDFQPEFMADISGSTATEISSEDFNPTFHSSRYEREWILNWLGEFYDDLLITDVLSKVKGGKEATVYCCAAHPSTGLELIAAKVYRPRIFRNLRNDARYRQGRKILDSSGQELLDERLLRAVGKKTEVGREVMHTSWIEHEYQTLQTLYAAGADVPRPVARGNNTILMEYLGEPSAPAPALNEVRLEADEARPMFKRLVRNVEIMLACNKVHGDLSAYNVLYWEGEVKLIDFPQAVDPRGNRDAYDIFQRDVLRLCQYFARHGVRSQPRVIAGEMWLRDQDRQRMLLERPDEELDAG